MESKKEINAVEGQPGAGEAGPELPPGFDDIPSSGKFIHRNTSVALC